MGGTVAILVAPALPSERLTEVDAGVRDREAPDEGDWRGGCLETLAAAAGLFTALPTGLLVAHFIGGVMRAGRERPGFVWAAAM